MWIKCLRLTLVKPRVDQPRRSAPMYFGSALLLLLITTGSCLAQALPDGPLPEAKSADIGYRTVAEALASLKKRKDVSISTERNWTIIVDDKNLTIWSFAPDSYIAHPAVVKRTARSRAGGGSNIEMLVLCEASKEACDQLVREFAAMNRRI
jgi:hypothetical protein